MKSVFVVDEDDENNEAVRDIFNVVVLVYIIMVPKKLRQNSD